MNNLTNNRFLEYKELNKKEIQYRLRYDMIKDLILRECICVCKDGRIYTVHQQNFEFYNGCELTYFDLDKSQCTQILSTKGKVEDIYVIEGILLDSEENRISMPINELLDMLVDMVLDKNYTLPTNKSICRVYDYFLEDFLCEGV